MTGTTNNRGYNVPEEGEENWHEPINENWHRLDEDIQRIYDALTDTDGGDTDGSTDDGSTDDGSTDPAPEPFETVLAAGDAERTNASLDANHDGFTGDGFINFDDIDSTATWTVTTPRADTYELTIRYANGASARTAELAAGGTTTDVTAEATGGWATWETMTVSMELPEGDVTVGLRATGADWGNVDQITLAAAE